MKSVWKFILPLRNEKTNGKYPTQKPLQLIERILRISTKEGDVVFEPLGSSNITGVA